MKKPTGKITESPTKGIPSKSQSLAAFIQTIQSVKTDTDESKLNETTMSDNNGKRISYTIIKGKKYPKQ